MISSRFFGKRADYNKKLLKSREVVKKISFPKDILKVPQCLVISIFLVFISLLDKNLRDSNRYLFVISRKQISNAALSVSRLSQSTVTRKFCRLSHCKTFDFISIFEVLQLKKFES